MIYCIIIITLVCRSRVWKKGSRKEAFYQWRSWTIALYSFYYSHARKAWIYLCSNCRRFISVCYEAALKYAKYYPNECRHCLNKIVQVSLFLRFHKSRGAMSFHYGFITSRIFFHYFYWLFDDVFAYHHHNKIN